MSDEGDKKGGRAGGRGKIRGGGKKQSDETAAGSKSSRSNASSAAAAATVKTQQKCSKCDGKGHLHTVCPSQRCPRCEEWSHSVGVCPLQEAVVMAQEEISDGEEIDGFIVGALPGKSFFYFEVVCDELSGK